MSRSGHPVLVPPSAPVSSSLRNRFVAAGFVSVFAWYLLRILAPGAAIPWTSEMEEAAETMARAMESLAEECRERGIVVDPFIDPNGTCLVGPELSPLFSSLGQLEAKRTSTNPDMAGLLVHLLSTAGVGEGDRVAVGASGSFPALLVASLSAIDALGARPVTMLSLGASSYGATRPEFHLGHLHAFLENEGVVAAPPAALSLGGEGDVGRGFDPEFREGLIQELRRAAASEPATVFIEEDDFRGNVLRRMALYGDPAAFVNIGGADVNLGSSPKVLNVGPGLVFLEEPSPSGSSGGIAGDLGLPPEEERGVLFEMASRGVPVLHLLHIRGLALRYGLAWDPIPLPHPGSTPLADGLSGKGPGFWLLTSGYILALAAVFVLGGGREHRGTVRQRV